MFQWIGFLINARVKLIVENLNSVQHRIHQYNFINKFIATIVIVSFHESFTFSSKASLYFVIITIMITSVYIVHEHAKYSTANGFWRLLNDQ